ncbi:MAG: HTH domain-containing protein [Evtepia sp.]
MRSLGRILYVASVTANTVRFTEAFKELAYEKKSQGIPVMETMRQYGIDPEILGASRVEGFSYTLNKKAKQESGFSDRRSENYRCPPKTRRRNGRAADPGLRNQLAYTRQEVGSKTTGGKYGGSETMGIQAPAEVKYGLILEAVRQDGNLLNISALCRIADVSRSGYYAWLDAAPLRQSREETDSTDFALVKQAYEFRGYKKGARSIYTRLLHLDPPVVMNIKDSPSYAKIWDCCPIRQANPYRQMAKAMKTSHVAKNEINRQFRSYYYWKALLTDITYIFYQGGVCYLSPSLTSVRMKCWLTGLVTTSESTSFLTWLTPCAASMEPSWTTRPLSIAIKAATIPATPLSRSSRMLPSCSLCSRKGNCSG